MEFKYGDRVEHKARGTGTFLRYEIFQGESTVAFDEDSDAKGETLKVTTGLLKKLEEKVSE